MKALKYNLSLILLISLICAGGFHDYSVALSGILISVSLFLMMIRDEDFYERDKRIVFWIPFAVLLISIVICFFAIDYMENLMGSMRIAVICMWMWLVRCKDESQRQFFKISVPFMGALMIIISVLAYLIPSVHVMFWENSRLSGFFQYANTAGLFLAIGVILLVDNWDFLDKKTIKIPLLVVLLIGTLQTGSRSVLALLFIWSIYHAISNKSHRISVIITIVSVIAISAIGFFALGNTRNIGRIFSLLTYNSTIWGRLLYYKDALNILPSHLLGMGRHGYYYTQGTFQSGVYHTKYVHNDILQLALDYGMISLILVGIFVVWQLLKGKQSKNDKVLLLFIILSALVDFHLQYLSIMLIAVVLLDFGNTSKEKRASLKENYILIPITFIIFTYIGIAGFMAKFANPMTALSLLPNYTYAQEIILNTSSNQKLLFAVSSNLIEKNPYNLSAHVTRGSIYASNGQVDKCMGDLDIVIELDPYNIDYYINYTQILENLKSAGAQSPKIDERIKSLPYQLADLKNRTSSMAYRIKDKPKFSYIR